MPVEKNSVLDVATGMMVRDALKHLLTWGLNRAERKSPKLFYSIAWMYLREEGKTSKQWFIGSIVLVGTWMDWLASQTKIFNQFKEVVESTFQDLPGSFSAYFERREREIKFPDNFEPPTLTNEEDVKALIKEFQAFIGQEIREDLPSFLSAVKMNKQGAAAERLVNLLVRCQDPFLVWWFHQYYSGLTPERKNTVLLAAHHLDELEELQAFSEHPVEVQDMILDLAQRSHDLSPLPFLSRLAKENWQKFNQAFETAMGMTADEARKLRNASEMGLAIRKIELERKRKERAAERKSPVQTKVWLTFAVILLLALTVMFIGPSCNKPNNKPAGGTTSLGDNTTQQSTAAEVWQPSAVMNSAPSGGSYHG